MGVTGEKKRVLLTEVGAVVLVPAAHGVDAYVLAPVFDQETAGTGNAATSATWRWIAEVALNAQLHGACEETSASDPMAALAAEHVAQFAHAMTGLVNPLWPADGIINQPKPAPGLQIVPIRGVGRWIFQPDVTESGARPTCHEWQTEASNSP